MENENVIESYADLKKYDLVTRYYSNKISSFYTNIDDYDISPDIQRLDAWSNDQKSELIESIMFNMPIPTIYTIKRKTNNQKIIEIVMDGKQLLSTIKDFKNNLFELKNLKVYKLLDGFNYFSLPETFKDRLNNYKLDFVCIENVNNDEIICDIFERFNTNGSSLNKQEIRNCVFKGPYNEMIKKISRYQPFYDLLKKEDIDRMDKEECVARFIALYKYFDLYNGDINNLIDKSYSINSDLTNITPEEFMENEKELSLTFYKLVDLCLEVFGQNAFKSIIKNRKKDSICPYFYRQFSKPVFDLQILGFDKFDYASIRRNAKKIKEAYEYAVLNDTEIKPDHSKMSKKAFTLRIEKWRKIISEILNNEM